MSLWDLNTFKAHDLMRAVRHLANQGGLIIESQNRPGYRRAAVDSFAAMLSECREICQILELPMSALHALQLHSTINADGGQLLDAIGAERVATMLSTTIENELSLRSFLAISPEKAKFYNDSAEPFGEEVAKAFPSTSFDATEANKCFALNRGTACVFHLMRVLEIGLGIFALRFNVPADHTNWH